ncbi:MAG: hypothetical protein ACRYG4_07095, partial [Janthinobacterium lividum]
MNADIFSLPRARRFWPPWLDLYVTDRYVRQSGTGQSHSRRAKDLNMAYLDLNEAGQSTVAGVRGKA